MAKKPRADRRALCETWFWQSLSRRSPELVRTLGVYLTLHPPNSSTAKRYKGGFILIGFVSAASIGLQAYRGYSASSELSKIISRQGGDVKTIAEEMRQPPVVNVTPQINIPPATSAPSNASQWTTRGMNNSPLKYYNNDWYHTTITYKGQETLHHIPVRVTFEETLDARFFWSV